ncbi:Uncharacterised protein [Mycobacteroides abscessus]|nr:Uncharacterised protein [Mycobacteroides abscessus]
MTWSSPSTPVIVPTSPVTPSTSGSALAAWTAGHAAAHSPSHALVPEPFVSLS